MCGGGGVKNYTEVMLMTTLYHYHRTVLSERLKRELEEKESPNPRRFMKRMRMMSDKHYVNYLVNKRIEREKCGMTAIFVDLRAAEQA